MESTSCLVTSSHFGPAPSDVVAVAPPLGDINARPRPSPLSVITPPISVGGGVELGGHFLSPPDL